MDINWDLLRDKLAFYRSRPIFDKEIYDYRCQLDVEPYMRMPAPELRANYLDRFHSWVTSSKLNSIVGLNAFPDRDVIVGVTQFLDDLHIFHSQSLVVLENEYPYHFKIRKDMRTRKISELRKGDVLLISMPHVGGGIVHPRMPEILERCEQQKIPIHIDSAWYGCTRGIEFNYDHPTIQSIGFSLSKGFGMGADRIGVRYSRIRSQGLVTVVNDYNMVISSLMCQAILCIEKFPADYFQNKYGAYYQQACEAFDLEPGPAIHVATGIRPDGSCGNIGLKAVLEQCLNPMKGNAFRGDPLKNRASTPVPEAKFK